MTWASARTHISRSMPTLGEAARGAEPERPRRRRQVRQTVSAPVFPSRGVQAMVGEGGMIVYSPVRLASPCLPACR